MRLSLSNTMCCKLCLCQMKKKFNSAQVGLFLVGKQLNIDVHFDLCRLNLSMKRCNDLMEIAQTSQNVWPKRLRNSV